MFADKKDKRATPEPGNTQNRINEGTKLKGDISSTGFFRIDGTIEGNVKTPSKVVLGKTGIIKGTLTCENADLEGRFEGNLNVTGTLCLRATSHIEGDVVVGKLSVEPGAIFNASCMMKGSAKEIALQNTTQPNPEKENINSQNHSFDRSQRLQKTKTEQPS